MAFCPNCGKALPEGVACDCQNNNVFGDIIVPKKKKSKKLLATVGVAVVIVVAVISASSLGGGYKKPVKDIVDSFNKGNSAKMFSAILTDDKIKEVKKELKGSKYDWKDIVDEIDDGLEDMMEDLEDDYGKNVKFSVKFLDKKKVKGDTLDEIEDLYEDMFDAEISKAYKVKVEMTIKGKEDEDSEKSWLYVAKVKGDGWKVSPYDDETGLTDLLGSSLF